MIDAALVQAGKFAVFEERKDLSALTQPWDSVVP